MNWLYSYSKMYRTHTLQTSQAIHGYRETEKSRWSSETQTILQRVRQAAFQPGASQLPLVHVLDLAENGYIKPHVDSIKVSKYESKEVKVVTKDGTDFFQEVYSCPSFILHMSLC